jgi:tetratricopeptide (TPR) repeat protein
MSLFFRASLVACLIGSASAAAAPRYDGCVAAIEAAPDQAVAAAQSWLEEGENPAARHCFALALVAARRYADAASQLIFLAESSIEDTVDHRAALYAQAGHAWMLADSPEFAEFAITQALALTPTNTDLLVDRARARADREDYWGAVEDLDAVLDLAPDRTDALVFRAAAYRRLDIPDLAAEDVSRALARDPNNVDALFERAMLALAVDAIDSARADFSRLLLLDPTSNAAALARSFLAELEADAN